MQLLHEPEIRENTKLWHASNPGQVTKDSQLLTATASELVNSSPEETQPDDLASHRCALNLAPPYLCSKFTQLLTQIQEEPSISLLIEFPFDFSLVVCLVLNNT